MVKHECLYVIHHVLIFVFNSDAILLRDNFSSYKPFSTSQTFVFSLPTARSQILKFKLSF